VTFATGAFSRQTDIEFFHSADVAAIVGDQVERTAVTGGSGMMLSMNPGMRCSVMSCVICHNS
jgi:hypothetical protein